MGHIFLSFLFYNVILLILYKHYKRGDYYINKKNLIFYTIIIIAFGTFGSGEGDYLHYKESVSNLNYLYDIEFGTGMEIQYNYLAYLVSGNYNLWRLAIFTIQFVGMSWFLYKAKLNTYPVFVSFVAMCMLVYTYQRSYWGIIFFYLGVLLLIEKKNPLYLIPIILCYYAHTQNIIVLIFLPFCFVNIKKWHIGLVIIFLGFLTTLFKVLFQYILFSGSSVDNRYLNQKIDLYGDGNSTFWGYSIGENLLFMLRYIPVIVITISWIYMILKNRDMYLSYKKGYRSFINATIGLVTLSILFMITSLGSGIFVYRILSMVLFPISILLPIMAENYPEKETTFKKYLWIAIICSEYSCVKDLFYAYANGNY